MIAKIVKNIHKNGYSKLADLAYFGHKQILEYCNKKNCQTIVHGGSNYNYRTMKRL